MQSYAIQQGTATQPLIFLLVLSSDHISPATGLTPTVTLSKAGAAFASPAGAVTEIGSGWYKVAANATDSNTLGPLALHATVATADPCDVVYPVVAFNPLAAANLGLTDLDATISSRSTYAGADTAGTTTLLTRIGGAITIAGGKVAATMGSTDYSGNTVQTGDSFGRIGALGAGLTALALHADIVSLSGQIGTPMQVGNVTVGGYAAGKDPAALVLDVAISGHETAGSVGAAIAAAGGSGDPLTNAVPGSYVAGTAGYVLGTNLDAAVSTRSTFAGGAVASVTAAVEVGSYVNGQDPGTYVLGTPTNKLSTDTSGRVNLMPTGLDSIPVTAPTGPAATFREMVVQTFLRFFPLGSGKVVKTTTGNTVKTYASDGTTVVTTQPWTDDGAGNETLGAAS